MKIYGRVLFWFLIAQSLLMWSAVMILAGSVEWPQSLDYPAATLMRLVSSAPLAVKWGYLCYLTSTLLFLPIVVLSERILTQENSTRLRLATILGLAGVFFKSLGILRWLTVQPSLAQRSDDPTAVVLFDALNRYLGSVGENFGVMLGVGGWTLFTGFYLLRQFPTFKRISTAAIAIALLSLIGLVELIGVTLPGWFLTLQGAGWQVWSVFFAVSINKLAQQRNA